MTSKNSTTVEVVDTEVVEDTNFSLAALAQGEHVTDKVRARFEAQSAEGVVNPIVLAALLEVRPQMIYQYLRKGKLVAVEDTDENSTQKLVITIAGATAWARQYVENKVTREAKRAEKLAAELAGETDETEGED
jgi:predicted nucleic acid-binding protein